MKTYLCLAFTLIVYGSVCAQSVLPTADLVVADKDGHVLLTCKNSSSGFKDCVLAEGKLNELISLLIDQISVCYARDGRAVHYLRDTSAMEDCMYNGATYRDWHRYSDTLESSRKLCRNRKGSSRVPYYDPILRKTLMLECEIITR